MAVTAFVEDAEMVKIAEDELEKLQKQYRIMEMDKNNVVSSARPTLRMQRNLQRILENELEKIVSEIQLCNNASNQAEFEKLKQQLNVLNKELENYSIEVNTERTQIRELGFLAKQIEKEIATLKASNGVKEKPRDVSKVSMVSQLENRLDNITKRYNKVAGNNRKIRADIDRMLYDRKSFNVLWANSIKKMMEGKSKILELVEQAISTYDQREEWCSKLENLKEKASQDYKKHCQEVRELQRQLDHALKLEDFLKTKTNSRAVLEDPKAEAKKLRKEEVERERFEENCAIIETAKEYTGQSSVERLIVEFDRIEEENFTLFNYVNEMNMEVQALNESVKKLSMSLDEERHKHEARLEKQKDSAESLQLILNENVAASTSVLEELNKTENVLKEAVQAIDEFARIAECHSMPIISIFGKELNVTESNVQLFMQCIELRIVEVVGVISGHELAKKQALLDAQKTPPSSRRKSTRSSGRRLSKSPRNRIPSPSPMTSGRNNNLVAN